MLLKRQLRLKLLLFFLGSRVVGYYKRFSFTCSYFDNDCSSAFVGGVSISSDELPLVAFEAVGKNPPYDVQGSAGDALTAGRRMTGKSSFKIESCSGVL